MKQKKWMALALSAVLALGCLTGCQNAAGSGQEARQAPEEETQQPAEDIAEQDDSKAEEEAPEDAGQEEEAATEAQDAEAADAADEGDDTLIRVVALKGPTAMGMVSMMDQAESEELKDHQYDFQIVAAVDEVPAMLAKGEVDLAAVPANLASVLFNNTEGEVQVVAINTLGVLYLVENGETLTDIADLKGKTIYASGQGATPEYALSYILKQNGIDPEKDVTIEWKSEHTECLTAITENDGAVALLPQPFVTTAQMKAEGIRVAFDLTKEWEKLQAEAENPSALLTGALVVRKEFATQHPEALEDFLAHYKESVAFTNNNLEEAAALIEKYDIVPAAVALKAIPACNIVYIDKDEMQQKLAGYLEVLYEQNPKSVGGQLPAEDFYIK